MERGIGDRLIGNFWIVEGIYELSEEKKEWIRTSDYAAGKVVWRFRETGTLVAIIDGVEGVKIPFSIIYGKLHLDLSAHKPDPDYSGYKESYLIVERADGILLYDLKTKIDNGYWLALKLIPAGQCGDTASNDEPEERQTSG